MKTKKKKWNENVVDTSWSNLKSMQLKANRTLREMEKIVKQSEWFE